MIGLDDLLIEVLRSWMKSWEMKSWDLLVG